ncbi:hypothetical protein [Montanilutibacter psychrotolerans]|uniref:Uncharacterized protein n=1 Tax=Montanilutibacter psychrotolerans TaxID=1327343 RepID=A0A3M8SP33_9GAMM|nr:hypothetical protein [Lysobacter psychrotolerans]RNF83077.1 hypothetical protein EER27_11190 [Lysobacter psychrotolerans]
MPIATWLARTLLAAAGMSPIPGIRAQASEVALARLDCGNEPQSVSVASFSDTFAYPDLKLPLTYSCHLMACAFFANNY